MEEDRGSSPPRTLKSGTILFDGTDGIHCTVGSISENRAYLELESSADIPTRFVLLSNKVIHLCHVEMRAGRRLGVRFETP